MIKIFLYLVVPVLMVTSAQLCLKKGMSSLGTLSLSFQGIFNLILGILQNVWMMTGLAFFGIGFFSWLFALSKLQLSFAYPIFVSAGIILMSVSSYFLFGERLSNIQIIGVLVIIFGIFLLVSKS